MERVCRNWAEEAFDDTLVQETYWEEFVCNATAASAEIHRVRDYAAAGEIVLTLCRELQARKIVAVGAQESAAVAAVYTALETAGCEVYTDKFAIAEQAPTADVGISTAEFGVGETGSVCIDAYSYEARVVGMLPPVHIVFLPAWAMVRDVTTAFQVISRVFQRGYAGFITGPSRTADIERVLTLGCHGPSRFIIIAVEERCKGGES